MAEDTPKTTLRLNGTLLRIPDGPYNDTPQFTPEDQVRRGVAVGVLALYAVVILSVIMAAIFVFDQLEARKDLIALIMGSIGPVVGSIITFYFTARR